MRFSVWPDNEQPFAHTVAIARECERRGWHAVYYADHFMPNAPDATPRRGDTHEALTTLAALAASTERIALGTLVASATYRHPALAAKSFATLDRLSGGRAIVGLGAGWQANEHASYGIELGTITERIDRFAEYVAVVDSMLRHETTDFAGHYYTLAGAPCDPRPVQDPPPLLLGVSGPRRTTALAAQYAAVWNAWTMPERLGELNAVLDGHCERLGRDPRSLARSTQALVFIDTDETRLAPRRGSTSGMPTVVGTPGEVLEVLATFEAAGCDEFILPVWGLADLSRALDVIALFDEGVARELSR